MKKILLLLLIVNVSLISTAQVDNVKRIEIELKDGFVGEKTYSFKEKGFLLFAVSKNKIKGNRVYRFDNYNNALEKTTSKKIYISDKLYMSSSYTNDDNFYILFKSKKGEFTLLTYNFANSDISKVNGTLLSKKTAIGGIRVLNNVAYAVTRIKKIPYLLSIDAKTGKQKSIPIKLFGESPKKVYVKNMQVLEEEEEIFVYSSITLSKKESKMQVYNYSEDGNEQFNLDITKGVENNIVSISASKIDDEEYVFTGTYSKNISQLAEGMFFCIVKEGEVDIMNFYPFVEMDGFFDYLPEKKKKKIEKKISKKKSKGKEVSIKYLLASHNVKKIGDSYIYIGEAYYPTYRTETSTTTSSNGSTVTKTRQVFDGYQYTHAIVIGFDEEGELQWNNHFSMHQQYKPFVVKRFIAAIEDEEEENIKLVYSSFSRIYSKSFSQDGSVDENNRYSKIETDDKAYKVKSYKTNMQYWYGNYFLADGAQIIKSSSANYKKKRKVLFLSKIEF